MIECLEMSNDCYCRDARPCISTCFIRNAAFRLSLNDRHDLYILDAVVRQAHQPGGVEALVYKIGMPHFGLLRLRSATDAQ